MGRFILCVAAIASIPLLASCAVPTPAPIATPAATEALPTPTSTPLGPTPTATLIPTPTHTPTATASPAPTSTATPIPAYTLSGIVFFDYNGNGIQDEGEPPIEGVPISVGGLSTTSGPDGSYSLEGVSAGTQAVYVESPTHEPATAFRYISLSLEAFRSIEEPITVSIHGETSLEIALMQGFLTLPFSCETEWRIGCYQNLLDPAQGCRTWADNSNYCGVDHLEGMDYAVPRGTITVATAPGVVEEVVDYGEEGLNVIVEHEYRGAIHRQSTYGHLIEALISAGEQVERGQAIGLTGDYGTYPHLHFGFYAFTRDAMGYATPVPGQARIAVDPYRDLVNANSESYWTVDNDPQCLP